MFPKKKFSLKTNAVANWCNNLFSALAVFVSTPLVIEGVGKAGYGVWVLITSFSGYYGLINMGLSSSLIRYVALGDASEDSNDLRKTINTALLAVTITASSVIVFALCTAGLWSIFFKMPVDLAQDFTIVFRLCAIGVGLEFLSAITSAVLMAHEAYVHLNVINIIRAAASLVGIYLCVHFRLGLVGLAIVTLVVTSLGLVANFYVCRKVAPQIAWGFSHASLARFKELVRYGSSTFIMQVVNIARLKIGLVVLARTVDVTAVAYFSVAVALIERMHGFILSGISVFTPRFARLSVANDKDKLNPLFLRSLFASAFLASLFALCGFLFSEPFISLWLGPAFVPAVLVFKILLVGYTAAWVQASGWNLMFAMDRHHFMAKCSVWEVLFIIIVGTVFAKQVGILGYAIATSTSLVVSKCLIQPLYMTRITGLPLREYLEPMLIPTVVASACLASVELANIKIRFAVDSLSSIILGGGVLLVFCASVYVGVYRRPYGDGVLPKLSLFSSGK